MQIGTRTQIGMRGELGEHPDSLAYGAREEKVRSIRTTRQPSGRIRTIFMMLCLLAGLACILYPAIASYVNERQFDNVITQYDYDSSHIDEATKQSMLATAKRYNESLAGDPVHDPFVIGSGFAVPSDYNEVLNVDGNGLIGYIKIPSIDVNLPINHNTRGEVLEKGAGHVPQTSFPIGGESTHAVITGHTGLPTARLFTDLIRLKEGDIFIIDVLGDKHAYKVDNIQVVRPDQVESVHIETGREYVTLLTCTPYGINSERLLVRGAPTDMPADDQLPGNPVPWNMFFFLIALFVILCVVWCVVCAKRLEAKGRLGRWRL